ncbi:hypothetical protein BGAL_0025g00560 [Botrytis galanthina]|uniref:Ppe family protein n=1 Tax=Botrytis galanthina TaxID=278940 RepID=A0A4S8RDC9_9HELO|nr:hypothetical protein BGAL_0025g00560 [Botrytis galanthina]
MKFSYVLVALSALTFSTALPVIRPGSINGLVVRAGNSTSSLSGNSTASTASSTSSDSAKPTTAINLEDINENVASSKATFASKKVTAAQVKSAVSGFASDANTVSAALNKLPSMTDKSDISALAGKAFAAESDEDSQRSVLFAAAGSAGSSANSKIVKNTPAVLKGLKAMVINPSTASVKSNVATIESARNPNILPSITQLSNAALGAMSLSQTAQKFPATGTN